MSRAPDPDSDRTGPTSVRWHTERAIAELGAGLDYCWDRDDCDHEHESAEVLGSSGEAVFECKHRSISVSWSWATPIDNRYDELLDCSAPACPGPRWVSGDQLPARATRRPRGERNGPAPSSKG